MTLTRAKIIASIESVEAKQRQFVCDGARLLLDRHPIPTRVFALAVRSACSGSSGAASWTGWEPSPSAAHRIRRQRPALGRSMAHAQTE